MLRYATSDQTYLARDSALSPYPCQAVEAWLRRSSLRGVRCVSKRRQNSCAGRCCHSYSLRVGVRFSWNAASMRVDLVAREHGRREVCSVGWTVSYPRATTEPRLGANWRMQPNRLSAYQLFAIARAAETDSRALIADRARAWRRAASPLAAHATAAKPERLDDLGADQPMSFR